MKKLYEDWSEVKETNGSETRNAKLIRSEKLNDKNIVVAIKDQNNLIAHPYVPGEENSVKLKSGQIIGTGDDIYFDNDIEIAKVEYEKNIRTARRPDITLAPLYDRAEWVSISPATGEDKDYVGIVIVAIGNLTMLACGIILIKRRLNHK